jgi:L-fuconolactonase
MPHFPIVDTHLHVWDRGRRRDPWLASRPSLDAPGLSFCLHHRQRGNLLTLRRPCPTVRGGLDQIARPALKARRLDPWCAERCERSKLDNGWGKLSGLVTEADRATWTPAEVQA